MEILPFFRIPAPPVQFAPAGLLLALMLDGGPAGADFKASASFMTDEIYRGYSKSRNNPALSGNLEYGHESGVYGGLWVANVSFDDKDSPDRASVEITPYLGWSQALAENWRSDLSVYGYVYDGKLFGRNSDYAEFATALHYGDVLTARFAYAPDAYGRNAATFAYEVTGRYSLSDDWRLSAGLGYYQASELLHRNVFYWNAGFTWYPTRYLAADLRYVDTTAGGYSGSGNNYDEFQPRVLDRPVLFTLSAGF